MSTPFTILKFGSSVLRSGADFGTAVREVSRHAGNGGHVVAVASAAGDTTDALLEEAHGIARSPEPRALASLLATGERQSAALLALALAAAGLDPVLLDPAEIGLEADGPPLDAVPVGLDQSRLARRLEGRRVAVLPGFFGIGPGGEVALFGRGGSDLTALFAAHALGARCRLLKDVGGVFEHDPAAEASRPRRYQALSWDAALGLGARVVQRKALLFARDAGVSFEVGAPGAADGTLVGPGPTRFASLDASLDRPRELEACPA